MLALTGEVPHQLNIEVLRAELMLCRMLFFPLRTFQPSEQILQLRNEVFRLWYPLPVAPPPHSMSMRTWPGRLRPKFFLFRVIPPTDETVLYATFSAVTFW